MVRSLYFSHEMKSSLCLQKTTNEQNVHYAILPTNICYTGSSLATV